MEKYVASEHIKDSKVIGFPCEAQYSSKMLEMASPKRKYEMALEDEDCVVYESLEEFFPY